MGKRIKFIAAIMVFVLAFAGMIAVQYTGNDKNNDGNVEAKGQPVEEEEEFAQPVASSIEYIPSAAMKESGAGNLDELKSELQAYLKQFEGKYGIYYENLYTGEAFGINEKDEYTAASTIKIPISTMVYKGIEKGTIDPGGKLTYEKGDYEEGTGEIQFSSEVGAKFKIRDLTRLMIESSDNIATNMLLRYLGKTGFKDYMRDLGGSMVKNDSNVSSPHDMAIYMRDVYNFSFRGELGEELIEYYENTMFNSRIPRLLPEEVLVAHKTGDQVGVANDVGVVFVEKPYILAVMSKDINLEEGDKAISNISKKIFDYVTK